jgi:hypothetical protein
VAFRKYPKARKREHEMFPLKNTAEDKVALQLCEQYDLPLDTVTSTMYEVTDIPYVVDSVYRVDFTLPNGIMLEVKGLWEPEDRRKHLLVRKQHPELDIRLVFVKASTKIGKGSNTSYSDWCDKHGILWSSGRVPREWFE